MKIVRKKSFNFSFNPEACETCGGNCCRGTSGNIWVNSAEIAEIAGFLNLNLFDFINEYLDRKDNRYSLREKFEENEYICGFFDKDKKKCRIYPVRPQQCRTYPFWDYFKTRFEELSEECPGVKSL
jgi:Fe-S-cluster containining protein